MQSQVYAQCCKLESDFCTQVFGSSGDEGYLAVEGHFGMRLGALKDSKEILLGLEIWSRN